MTSERDVSLSSRELIPLVQAEQVIWSVDQVRRIPWPHFFMDVCIAWTGWHAGLSAFAWIWLAVITTSQVGRTLYVVHVAHVSRFSPPQMLARLGVLLVALGAMHSIMIIAVFARPASDAHYILTMILVGTAAGAVSPAAGDVRSYVAWALVVGGTLAMAWLVQGTLESAAIAALLVSLFVVLTLYVKDQGKTIVKLVTLTVRLQRASEAKTRFFAAASHDLRQPLTALGFNAATVQALAQRDGDDLLARVGEGIQRALAESRALLTSLLEISQLDAKAITASSRNVDVTRLIREMREMYAPLAEERGLVLETAGDSRESIVAWADPDLLRRIIQNLLANAIKFTAAGSVSVRALIDVDSGRVVVRVSDTGPGIPLEEQERVFEEFYQVGNVERDRSRGLGLGLAITQRLSDLMGGRIHLSSAPGHGACFDVSLPSGEALDLPSRPAPATKSRQSGLMNGARVIVLDDEAEIREALGTYLTTTGWSVRTVATKDEAVHCLEAGFQPHALVLDFRLRDGTSGLETLRTLRQMGCKAAAVLITGDTEPSRIAAAAAAGVPVIYKPVDGNELLRILEQELAVNPLGSSQRLSR